MSRTIKRDKEAPKAVDPVSEEARKRQVRKEMRGLKEALEEAFPGLEAHIVYGDEEEEGNESL